MHIWPDRQLNRLYGGPARGLPCGGRQGNGRRTNRRRQGFAPPSRWPRPSALVRRQQSTAGGSPAACLTGAQAEQASVDGATADYRAQSITYGRSRENVRIAAYGRAFIVGRFKAAKQAGQMLAHLGQRGLTRPAHLGQRGLTRPAGLRQPGRSRREVLQAEDGSK